MRFRSSVISTRGIVLCLVTSLLLVVVALDPIAEAGKRKKVKRVERVAEAGYFGATGVSGVEDSPCLAESVGCVTFPVEDGERFVSIEITDSAGQPVRASIYNYGYTDGTDTHAHVCGSSDGVLPLGPDLENLVVIMTQTTGGTTEPCAGPATQGTVLVHFTNIP